MKNKIIAQNTKGEGMLSMKQSKDLEAKKSEQQKNEELCNFLKNAFCVDGDVQMIAEKLNLSIPVYFLLKDSKRGTIRVTMELLK